MKHIRLFEEFNTSFIKTNNFMYGFKLSDINYLVKFIEKDENSFEIYYGSIDRENLSVKFDKNNKGDIYRIISTVSDCVKDFVKNERTFNPGGKINEAKCKVYQKTVKKKKKSKSDQIIMKF